MGTYLSVITMTAIVFCVMIIHLAAKPKFNGKLTSIFIAISIVGGLLFYGYGNSLTRPSLPLAVIHSLISVCGMFVGRMDYSTISDTPILQAEWVQIVYWIIHLFAFYATASAAVTLVGAEVLRNLRQWLARWGELNLIFGVNINSVALGKDLLQKKGCSVVYVAGSADAGLTAAITKSGCILRSDAHALQADRKFLRSIGIRRGTRKIHLYTLAGDPAEDIRYAKAFLTALEACKILPQQTSLVISAQEDSSVSQLQVLGDQYGYGYVSIFREAELAARLLIQTCPPCNCITFDEIGRAESNFEALIIGFGQVGQAVLRQLVMNGQFTGSTFRATVFAPDCEAVDGYFSNSFAPILDQYDISFQPYDARSRRMYQYILQRKSSLKYVVVCAGKDRINREIAEDLAAFLHRQGLELPVYQCSCQGLRITEPNGSTSSLKTLYQSRLISQHDSDRLAMLLNHYYMNDSSKTPLEHWMECNYFNRMSSRASADFVGAVLRAAHKTEAEAVQDGGWSFSDAHLENLSIMEHLRWCAFHYCMGFTAMEQAEFDARSKAYAAEVAATGKSSIRISKNMADRTHACLVDWDALDSLSAKENAVTGKSINYKAMDTENILAVPKLLQLRNEV